MGSAALVEARAQILAAPDAELNIANDGCDWEALELALKEVSVKVSAKMINGENLDMVKALGDGMLDLKAEVADHVGKPIAQLRFLSDGVSLEESGQLMEALFKEQVTKACNKAFQEHSTQGIAANEMQGFMVDACSKGLEAEVQVVIISVVTVSTEEEFRKAVVEGAQTIRIPEKLEITLQEGRPCEIKYSEGEEEEQEVETTERDDEDEEEEQELEAVPLIISQDLTISGGSGSVLKQTSFASCGVREECSFVVDGVAVRLEGITIDFCGVRVINGGSVHASSCHIINGWFASESESSLQIDSCSMHGSIGRFVAVSEGATAIISKTNFRDGGCWSPNLVAQGAGSKITMCNIIFENGEGSSALSALDGGSLICEDGSATGCGNFLLVEGIDSSASLKDIVLEGRDDPCGIGIQVREGGNASLNGVKLRNFDQAIRAGTYTVGGSNIRIKSANLSENGADNSDGIVHDDDQPLIVDDDV